MTKQEHKYVDLIFIKVESQHHKTSLRMDSSVVKNLNKPHSQKNAGLFLTQCWFEYKHFLECTNKAYIIFRLFISQLFAMLHNVKIQQVYCCVQVPFQISLLKNRVFLSDCVNLYCSRMAKSHLTHHSPLSATTLRYTAATVTSICLQYIDGFILTT